MDRYTREFIGGSLAGATGVMSGHPLDLLKTMQQNQSASSTASKIGFRDLALMARTKGPSSLFDGVVPPLLAGVAYQSVVFPAYQFGLSLQSRASTPAEDLSWREIFNAGVFAGVMTTLVTTPLENAKVQLQLNPEARGAGKSGATRAELLRLYRSGQLYSGWTSMVLRDGPSTGVYLGGYHVLKSVLRDYYPRSVLTNPSHERLATEMLAGGIAGVLCWWVVMPLDVVKTRIQFDPKSYRSQSVFGIMQRIARNEGMGVLFRGAQVQAIRAFPVNALTFVVYERSIEFVDELDEHLGGWKSTHSDSTVTHGIGNPNVLIM